MYIIYYILYIFFLGWFIRGSRVLVAGNSFVRACHPRVSVNLHTVRCAHRSPCPDQGGAPRRPSPLSARVEAARMFAPLGAGVVPARRGCEWFPSTWNPVDKRIQRYRMGDVRDIPSCAVERVEVLAVATCVSWSLSTPPWHPSRRRYARWSGRIGRLR